MLLTDAIRPGRRGGRRGLLVRPPWRFPRGAGSSLRYCRRAGSEPRPCPVSGRWHRRYRSMRCADPAERSGECRASPPCGCSCFSGRYEPRPGTRFLSCRRRLLFRARLHPGAQGTFFKILDGSLGLRMMTGSCRELAVTHRPKLSAQRLLGDRDAELLVYPLRKIDQPPAHDTVDRRDRAALDHPHNRLALHIIEPRGLTWRLAVDQTIRPKSIELDDPVPDDLQRHAANL